MRALIRIHPADQGDMESLMETNQFMKDQLEEVGPGIYLLDFQDGFNTPMERQRYRETEDQIRDIMDENAINYEIYTRK